MPVEYNWVGDYEDPNKMKRDSRRGKCSRISVKAGLLKQKADLNVFFYIGCYGFSEKLSISY